MGGKTVNDQKHRFLSALEKDLTDSRKGTILGAVTAAPDYADQLRAADLRVTRPRLAVLEAVHAHPHADTESIFGAVRADLPEVSRQAVYDVLRALMAFTCCLLPLVLRTGVRPLSP